MLDNPFTRIQQAGLDIIFDGFADVLDVLAPPGMARVNWFLTTECRLRLTINRVRGRPWNRTHLR